MKPTFPTSPALLFFSSMVGWETIAGEQIPVFSSNEIDDSQTLNANQNFVISVGNEPGSEKPQHILIILP